MKSYKPLTKKNARKVLMTIADYIENEPDYTEMYLYSLTEMLDDLWKSDGFGTEGQTDPRGDHRD